MRQSGQVDDEVDILQRRRDVRLRPGVADDHPVGLEGRILDDRQRGHQGAELGQVPGGDGADPPRRPRHQDPAPRQ